MVRKDAAGIIVGAVTTGMVIGGLVGAVIALLYAPSSGEETRAKMRGKAIELQNRANDTVSQTLSKAQELKQNALDKAAEMKQRAKTIADVKLD